MKNNNRFAAFILSLLLLLAGRHCNAQHYDFFYTCTNSSYSSLIDYLKSETGYVSIDIDNKEIVFHNLKDSQVVDFKHPELKGYANDEWWLTLPQESGDSWDGYILYLDEQTKQPTSLSRRYTMKGEGEFFSSPKKTYYKYPPFSLSKEPFYTWKQVPASGTGIPDLRGNEYACFKDIVSATKKANSVSASRTGDELRITETPYREPVKQLYNIKLDPESIYLISKEKHHGIYFNGVETTDSNTTYEVFYGINRHLDMTSPVLQVVVYKNNIYQHIDFFGALYADDNNEKNYVPWVPPVISGCLRCKGTGKVAGAGICKRCSGRGHQKTTIYRSADQVIKR